jgi:hypothetical protein
MIIKRWNGTAFVEEYPKTKAQLIVNNANSTTIFDTNDKIKAAYLPDSVFDSLLFYGTTTGDVGASLARSTLAESLLVARSAADTADRSVVGYYWVITATGTITGLTGIQDTVTTNEYATLQFRPQDAGSSGTANTSSGVLEVGDWFVIENVSGAGTSGSPYVFTASVINNSYELATTAIDGVVRLSSQSTYASLSGNNVVTDGRLKTLIDNASFALSGHVHGNVLNDGTITTNTAAASGQHLVITSSGNLIQQSAIELGSSSTTFLTNAGTWATPVGTYSLPAATATVRGGIELFSDTQQSVAANAVSSTASRSYGIQVNSDGQGVVNVPWTDTVYTLPQATTSALGGVKLGTTAATATVNSGTTTGGRFYHVGAQTDGTMYVNVPWTDTTYSAATATALGLIELADNTVQTVAATAVSATASRTYGLQVNSSGQGVINVPWTDTVYTLPAATSTVRGGIELGSDTVQSVAANAVSATASRSYALQVNSDAQGVVNVPWTDTTYSAGEGITLSSTTFRMHYPLYVQTATPTTSVTGTIWYDIN